MAKGVFNELAETVERETGEEPALAARIAEALALAGISIPGSDAAPALAAVDAALGLAAWALPGWSVRLEGTASVEHGNWHCVVRGSTSDNEEAYPGVGKSNRPSRAILAALFRALALRATA